MPEHFACDAPAGGRPAAEPLAGGTGPGLREERPLLFADAPGVADLRRLRRALRDHGPHRRPERSWT